MEFKDTMLAEIIIVDDIKVLFFVDLEYDEEQEDEIYKLHYKLSLNGIKLERTINFVPDVDIDEAWNEISQQFERVAFEFVEESKRMIEELFS